MIGNTLPVSVKGKNARSTLRVDLNRLRGRGTLVPVIELLPAKADTASYSISARGLYRYYYFFASLGPLGLLVVYYQELAVVALQYK